MKQNLFKTAPNNLPEELIEILVSFDNVRIERIVSRGHSSPRGFWYDQDSSEFVVLLSGSARLAIEGKNRSIDFGPGDWLNIPAHTKRRVESTDPTTDTIWLASTLWANEPPRMFASIEPGDLNPRVPGSLSDCWCSI